MALELAARGPRVVINGRSAGNAQAVLEEIPRQGGEVCFAAGDVRSKSDIEIDEHVCHRTLRLCVDEQSSPPGSED